MEWYNKIEFEKISDPTVLFNIGLELHQAVEVRGRPEVLQAVGRGPEGLPRRALPARPDLSLAGQERRGHPALRGLPEDRSRLAAGRPGQGLPRVPEEKIARAPRQRPLSPCRSRPAPSRPPLRRSPTSCSSPSTRSGPTASAATARRTSRRRRPTRLAARGAALHPGLRPHALDAPVARQHPPRPDARTPTASTTTPVSSSARTS